MKLKLSDVGRMSRFVQLSQLMTRHMSPTQKTPIYILEPFLIIFEFIHKKVVNFEESPFFSRLDKFAGGDCCNLQLFIFMLTSCFLAGTTLSPNRIYCAAKLKRALKRTTHSITTLLKHEVDGCICSYCVRTKSS